MFAPPFKTPHTHTHNKTLHTGLMLTRGICAFVVGSQRRRIITHDLDIYKCALQIKHSSKQYSACRYIVFAALHGLYKTIAESGIDTYVPLKVVLKLLQLFVESMVTIYT